jgi:hypothetical protein
MNGLQIVKAYGPTKLHHLVLLTTHVKEDIKVWGKYKVYLNRVQYQAPSEYSVLDML